MSRKPSTIVAEMGLHEVLRGIHDGSSSTLDDSTSIYPLHASTRIFESDERKYWPLKLLVSSLRAVISAIFRFHCVATASKLMTTLHAMLE